MRSAVTTSVLLAPLLLFGCSDSRSSNDAGTFDTCTKESGCSWLFVVDSAGASLEEGTLTLTDVSDQIVAYTGRPYRQSASLTWADLIAGWAQGSDSFAEDPPNAILGGDNIDPQGAKQHCSIEVELTQAPAKTDTVVTWDANELARWDGCPVDTAKTTLSDVTLFIDSISGSQFGLDQHIGDAGIVLMQSYLVPLFKIAGLVENGAFVSEQARYDCMMLLHFAATGTTTPPDASQQFLPRLLCGVSSNVTPSFEPLTATDEEAVESLLTLMIDQWDALGQSSVDGFRGNWLVRDGSVSETSDHYSLVVEKRAYDVLLNKCPFFFSLIELPWMTKPIFVTWPT